jgi:hypothetical protein
MMARREKKVIEFIFSTLECKIIERVLEAIIKNYQVPPDELDSATAAVWYSTRGCKSARMSAAETADWVKQLRAVRSGRLEMLQKWLADLRSRPPGAFTLRIELDKAEALMTAINDHRLLLAAQHNIGEEELEMRTLAAFTNLPAETQRALYEIHFLAYIIEELIYLLHDG